MTVLSFDRWMKLVDIEVGNITHGAATVHDLADICFRDLFDDGVSSREAAEEVIASDDLASLFFEV